MSEPILSREEVEAIAHRTCMKYFHADGPEHRRYVFGMLTLEQFSRAIEAAVLEKVCGEPRAWLVEGGRMFQDKPFLREANADISISERKDGARKTALYALTRSKP